MSRTNGDHRLTYVKAEDLDRWQCRPLGTIDVLDLRDRRVGHLDGVIIDRQANRPVYIAVSRARDAFLVPVGDAWFDDTERAIRIDAAPRERVHFDPEAFDRMSPEEADEYERRVLASCCPEVGFHRDGRPDYARQAMFTCPTWLRPQTPDAQPEASNQRAVRPDRRHSQSGDHIMATLRTVPRSEWRQFFDRMSKALLLGKWAEIEVASPDIGDQIVAEWIPMIGVTYDSKDDLLDVALDRTDHLIYHPEEIVIEEGPEGLSSIAVTAADGSRQIVRLKEPLKLPAPEGVNA